MWQLRLARDLIENAFPDLAGDDSPTTVTLDTPFNREWLLTRRVQVRVMGRRNVAVGVAAEHPDDYLRADFFFGVEHLDHASFEGSRVKTREMAVLTAQAEAHPDWTDSQLGIALEKAGAKYGPTQKEAVIHAVRLDRFSGSLGKVSHADIRFRWRLGRPDLGSDDIATPSWIATIETSGSERQRGCYALFFEPIAVNLRSVISIPCR